MSGVSFCAIQCLSMRLWAYGNDIVALARLLCICAVKAFWGIAVVSGFFTAGVGEGPVCYFMQVIALAVQGYFTFMKRW